MSTAKLDIDDSLVNYLLEENKNLKDLLKTLKEGRPPSLYDEGADEVSRCKSLPPRLFIRTEKEGSNHLYFQRMKVIAACDDDLNFNYYMDGDLVCNPCMKINYLVKLHEQFIKAVIEKYGNYKK